MKIIDKDLSLCRNMTDNEEELVWLPIEKIGQSKIKPEFIKNCINDIIHENKIIHVIDERDR